MRITIVIPFPVTKPVGGAKIMYEYSNRLATLGHKVTIYHSIKRPFKKSSSPVWLKQFIFFIRGVQRPKWFPLLDSVKSVIVPAITNRYIADADVILSTWWQMTYAIHALNPSKGKKFNLIQDIEMWKGEEDKVMESYRLPIYHLVIAKYLQKLVLEKSGKEPIYLPNAIDDQIFFISVQPAERNPATVIMLYSEEPRKDTASGLAALKKLKITIPSLQLILFGVYEKPANLENWMEYHQRPSNLPELYNRAAVFFSPSLYEGWALPPAEAMACGCAVVCTDIGGHADYAINEQTALLVKPGDINDMAEKINTIITHTEKRLSLSLEANKLITTRFTWEASVHKLQKCFIEMS
ncbi:MAG: glycosyltransferase family 4 protein [Ferruginibacter sp.]